MRELKGISVAQGIAIGKTCMYSQNMQDSIPHYSIDNKTIKNEIERFENALKEAEDKIESIRGTSKSLFGTSGEDIISAHMAVLKDKGLRKKIIEFIEKEHVNAEHAILDVFDGYIEKLTGHGLHFEEISHDVIDVRDRILESFVRDSGRFQCNIGKEQAVVVVAERLTPSMIFNIPKENLLAFITKHGGYTSHATILARTLNIPVIFGIEIEKELSCNCEVIVDGSLGIVFVNPSDETKKQYIEKKQEQEARYNTCMVMSKDPAQTAEGDRIKLKVNLSTEGEINMLDDIGMGDSIDNDDSNVYYDGIGLLRTEFLFVKTRIAPTEEEQFSIYKRIIRSAKDKEIIVRLMDLSPDKVPPYMALEDNRDGIRGARAVEKYRELYVTQIRALLRASKEGNIKILLPMISDIDDINLVKELIKEVDAALKNEKIEHEIPEIGIMFETPSSILLSDILLKEIDFANIGTNDLLQYTVAASRDSLESQQNYHIMHPSIIRLIEKLVKEAEKTKTEICLCGEIGSYEKFYPVLLDLGLRSFSVPVLKFNDIKCELLHITKENIAGKAKLFLKEKTLQGQLDFFR